MYSLIDRRGRVDQAQLDEEAAVEKARYGSTRVHSSAVPGVSISGKIPMTV